MSGKWPRVFGPDLDPGNRVRFKANSKVLADKNFIALCERVNTLVTRRQASKFRRKKGLAFRGK